MSCFAGLLVVPKRMRRKQIVDAEEHWLQDCKRKNRQIGSQYSRQPTAYSTYCFHTLPPRESSVLPRDWAGRCGSPYRGTDATPNSYSVVAGTGSSSTSGIQRYLLACFGKQHYPAYEVTRTTRIFATRNDLLEYETALNLQAAFDAIVYSDGIKVAHGLDAAHKLFMRAYALYRKDLGKVYGLAGRGPSYLLRFTAVYVYAKICERGTTVLARLKLYDDEIDVLQTLLNQSVFLLGRRGYLYDRLSLVFSQYKKDKRTALAVCEAALQDPLVGIAPMQSIKARTARLEKALKIPKGEQHVFDHDTIRAASEITIQGGIDWKESFLVYMLPHRLHTFS